LIGYIFRQILASTPNSSNLKTIIYDCLVFNLKVLNFHKMKNTFETTQRAKIVQIQQLDVTHFIRFAVGC